MKLLPIAAAFVALSARIAAADIVIDKMWSSTYDGSKVQELSNPAIKFVPGTPLTASVNVTDSQKAASKDAHDQVGINIVDNEVHQMVDALGGGITDSVAITLQDFKLKHPKEYDDLLHLLFSQDPTWYSRSGVGLNSVRVPLGACDFGVSPYTYDDTADGSEDMELELFTIKKAPKLWKTLKDILVVNPSLKIITAPWSAPGWMKENTDPDQPLFGGDLKPGMEEVFAKYLIKAVVEIKKEEGIDMYAMSLLNEPQIPTLQYPTMKMTVDQSVQVGKLVRAGLDAAGFKTVKCLAYDFNWDNTAYPLDVLNADPSIWAGVAWHGYAGNPSSQKVVHDAYPNIDAYFTEHTEITQYFSEPYKNMKNSARDLLVGSIRYYSRSIILWNLVLRKDEDGFTTPHLPNVCSNCNAAILLLPDSTDPVAAGDPNHTKTVAEANGQAAAADAKKDDKASRRKRSLKRRADNPVTPKPDPKAAPQMDETTTFTPKPLPRGTEKAAADQAVKAADVVDVKKTGNPSVYVSDLFKRTSDMTVLSHLSTAVRPVGESKDFSRRIGVTSTDEWSDLGGRMLAQAFRQDGVKEGVTRFSVIILNQNDHYETGDFEPMTAAIGFRDMVANVTTVPGLYTLSWEAPTVDSANAGSAAASKRGTVLLDAQKGGETKSNDATVGNAGAATEKKPVTPPPKKENETPVTPQKRDILDGGAVDPAPGGFRPKQNGKPVVLPAPEKDVQNEPPVSQGGHD